MPYVDYTTEEVKTARVKIGNVEVAVAVEPNHADGENTLYAYAYDSYLDDYTQDQVTISGYPIDFNKYELIEKVVCDGTSWVKTPLIGDENYAMTIEYMQTTSGSLYICGNNASSKCQYLYSTSTGMTSALGAQTKKPARPALNVKHIAMVDSDGVTIDGTLTAWDATVAAFTATKHLGVGNVLNSSDAKVGTGLKGYIYKWELYDKVNNVDLAYYVPAKRRSDGHIGFYDLVSGNFYESAGIGNGTTPFTEV